MKLKGDFELNDRVEIIKSDKNKGKYGTIVKWIAKKEKWGIILDDTRIRVACSTESLKHKATEEVNLEKDGLVTEPTKSYLNPKEMSYTEYFDSDDLARAYNAVEYETRNKYLAEEFMLYVGMSCEEALARINTLKDEKLRVETRKFLCSFYRYYCSHLSKLSENTRLSDVSPETTQAWLSTNLHKFNWDHLDST